MNKLLGNENKPKGSSYSLKQRQDLSQHSSNSKCEALARRSWARFRAPGMFYKHCSQFVIWNISETFDTLFYTHFEIRKLFYLPFNLFFFRRQKHGGLGTFPLRPPLNPPLLMIDINLPLQCQVSFWIT